ncbi:hypothetical protein KUTeg_008125 [Tegillarca granosa]|uniref:Rab-GAP TBC domain-containing protein n=1 Tax=Tegillarca granosa TaxID=220873 RepID=A0ABQ9F879_TEGGR|nr:hypothetical protein KUTeg_008125 [Tegillarca granosa]
MDFVQRELSVDESFEYVDYPSENAQLFDTNSPPTDQSSFEEISIPKESYTEEPSSPTELPVGMDRVRTRAKPLTEEDFKLLLDEDGRLVDEHALRRAVFMGGVDPKIRKEVWQFLFGLYPCTSTYREREDLLLDYLMKYHELKSRWKTMLVLNAKPGASLLQQGLVARYQMEEQSNKLRSPDLCDDNPVTEWEIQQTNKLAAMETVDHPDFSILSRSCKNLDISIPEMEQKINFMKIQAQVFVNRLLIDINSLWKHLRVIDKDVPRTDRDQEFFKIQKDFTEDGMIMKINLVVMLLKEMDPSLLEHLEKQELGDLLFCHRWLLLGFKREFSFDDSLRCFEILSSHHLELNSIEAEKARRQEQMKEFQHIGGGTKIEACDGESDYTFELFMCLALLEECRDELLQCTDIAIVFNIINNLKIDLDDILLKSAKLFYKYCKKSVEDSFLMVETPPILPKVKKKNISFMGNKS